MGKKFAQIDGRFEQIDERFKQINARFEQIDERFKMIDEGFEEMRKYIDDKVIELRNYVDGGFNELKDYIDNRVRRLGDVFVNYQEFFVEYLATEDVIRERQKDLLKNQAKRMFSLGLTNPTTKEEWRRVKELFEKDELTLEEALELRELARKIAWELGTPEAWKLHIYASVMVGLAMKKKSERIEKEKN